MAKCKLTDNLLGRLYHDMYQICLKGHQPTSMESPEVISNNMIETFKAQFHYGYLKTLNEDEKGRSIQVFQIIVESMPIYDCMTDEVKAHVRQRDTYLGPNPPQVTVNNYNSPGMFTWLLLRDLYQPRGVWWFPPASVDNHHHSHNQDDGNPMAKLLLVLVVGALVFSAFILTFFTLRELIDCSDRILFNEGRMRALMSMAIISASGCLGGILGTMILAIPLLPVAAAAAVSPALVMMMTGVALTLIGAGSAALLLNHYRTNERFIRQSNEDALDPAEPERFSLTQNQETMLEQKGIDIDRVKVAMAAIRFQMGSAHIEDKFSRLFYTLGKNQQNLLSQLRQIKAGKLDNISLAGQENMKINIQLRGKKYDDETVFDSFNDETTSSEKAYDDESDTSYYYDV